MSRPKCRPKCLWCDRPTMNAEKTLCAVHFSEKVHEARQARLRRARHQKEVVARIKFWKPKE